MRRLCAWLCTARSWGFGVESLQAALPLQPERVAPLHPAETRPTRPC